MSVLCFASEKGGVGKTLLCGNLAAYFAGRKKKVLLVDMDPQSHLSMWFLGEMGKRSVWESMKNGSMETGEISSSLHILPNNREMVAASLEMASRPNEMFVPKRAVRKLKNQYDLILIDTPPTFGQILVSSLIASDWVFFPVRTEFFSLNGLQQIFKTVEEIQEDMNPNLKIGGIIINGLDRRLSLCKNVEKELRDHFGKKVLKSTVRQTVRLTECTSEGSIFDTDPKGLAAEDFRSLGREILKIIK